MTQKFIQANIEKWAFIGNQSVGIIVYAGRDPESIGGHDNFHAQMDMCTSKIFTSLDESQNYCLEFDDGKHTHDGYFDPVS